MERFRLAVSTLVECEQKLQQAQDATSAARLELLSSDKERGHLRQTFSQQETEIQQVRIKISSVPGNIVLYLYSYS